MPCVFNARISRTTIIVINFKYFNEDVVYQQIFFLFLQLEQFLGSLLYMVGTSLSSQIISIIIQIYCRLFLACRLFNSSDCPLIFNYFTLVRLSRQKVLILSYFKR
ncbi:hypothetical protein FGO68_gene16426 [Halteria grandinella]|uniref:Uncharacterized protein n=1 Tax=Halteria grandinella TaxID=5974 RepID=A0A8J8NG30_HALGN|nr:hypothetical protein FGO68_gene16426 [Halteria grandinella]